MPTEKIDISNTRYVGHAADALSKFKLFIDWPTSVISLLNASPSEILEMSDGGTTKALTQKDFEDGIFWGFQYWGSVLPEMHYERIAVDNNDPNIYRFNMIDKKDAHAYASSRRVTWSIYCHNGEGNPFYQTISGNLFADRNQSHATQLQVWESINSGNDFYTSHRIKGYGLKVLLEHEMGHTLGLPDDYTHEWAGINLERESIMDQGWSRHYNAGLVRSLDIAKLSQYETKAGEEYMISYPQNSVYLLKPPYANRKLNCPLIVNL